MNAALDRAITFCHRFGLRVPVLLAPMAGACPPALSIAVANAGGLGACGALTMTPDAIVDWANTVRAASNGAFQINNWIPDPPPPRDPVHEARLCAFLGDWGPPVSAKAAEARPPNFDDQCAAMLTAGPPIISSIMGLYPPAFVRRMKAQDVSWFATVTTVAEALAAQAAGADVIVAQGAEAGGHRGAFEAMEAERRQVGLFALLPAIVDAVDMPVVAAGGIADARGMAAALLLGASAVQIGTGFLRCPEAGISAVWADAIARVAPEDTIVTRVFSGRAGRAIANRYVRAAMAPSAPPPAAHPVQRGLTAALRIAAVQDDDIDRMQAWAGQRAAAARADPAETVVREIWAGATMLLGGS